MLLAEDPVNMWGTLFSRFATDAIMLAVLAFLIRSYLKNITDGMLDIKDVLEKLLTDHHLTREEMAGLPERSDFRRRFQEQKDYIDTRVDDLKTNFISGPNGTNPGVWIRGVHQDRRRIER